MVYSLTWLPGALKAAGLKVAQCEGWESRGRGDMAQIQGVMCHHTAGALHGNMPSLNTLLAGRSDLAGPLAQLGLGRDGTFYVIAAGRANHAGPGAWNGTRNGNTHFIGIEVENGGVSADPWPSVQLDACQRGVAAILSHLRLAADCCMGHREYALPAGRKLDPLIDMNDFRHSVASILAGLAPPPVLIPAFEPVNGNGSQAPGRPTLRRGATGELVKKIQRSLARESDGYFGPRTEAAVREFQRQQGLVPDGIVGPKTWAAFGAS